MASPRSKTAARTVEARLVVLERWLARRRVVDEAVRVHSVAVLAASRAYTAWARVARLRPDLDGNNNPLSPKAKARYRALNDKRLATLDTMEAAHLNLLRLVSGSRSSLKRKER